jgi:predicted dehydrogenase
MHVVYNGEYERRLRTAFIGCGGHALRNILPTFQYAPVELIAVCDLNRDAAESAARVFGANAAYTDYREMLERERPEVVFVVTNYDERNRPRYPQIAIDCMHSDAHVWIEKPPASSSAEIVQMMDVSNKTGKTVMVGYKKMFFPANVKAHEIASREEFGGVTSVTARYPQYLPTPDRRMDDNEMLGFLDHIQHPWSVLLLLGGRAESIYVEHNERVGSSVTSIRFENGAIGGLHLAHGQSQRSFMERTDVVGWEHNVIVDNNVRVTWHRPGEIDGGYGRADTSFGNDDTGALHWEPEFSLGNLYNKGIFLLGYAPEVREFCASILEDRPPIHAGLEDALHIMRIYEAYRQPSGQVVRIAKS